MISFANSINSSLMCNTDECLSFIIVFLNLLTIFYLVYSSYRKLTKLTKIFGYIWSCFIMCASVVVLIFHTCVFTIAGTVFTAMAIIAVLSMIFEGKKEENSTNQIEVKEKKKDVGCYVIFPTTDNKFVFGLHNKKNELLAMSQYKYRTIEEAKEAINYTKCIGEDCEFEDLTQDWVVDAKHPKFRMYLKKQKYFFEFAASEDLTMLKSDAIDDASVSLRMVKEARRCVTSNKLYFGTGKKDIKNGKKFLNYPEEGKRVEENLDADDTFADSEYEIADTRTLAESLKEMENVKTTSVINKQTLFEYLNGKYGKKVVLRRRENKTKTGLPLADTYYAYVESENSSRKKACFAYAYENNGACLLLAKLDKKYAKSLKNKKKSIVTSKFPRSKHNNWFSIIVDDTYTEDEIHDILDVAKEYCEKQ